MSDFAGQSAKLALESIRNSYLREHYIEITRNTAIEILDETNHAEQLSPCQRHDIWKCAAIKASNLRNKTMKDTRNKMSSTADIFSKLIKCKTPSFVDLVKRYSTRLYGNEIEGNLCDMAEFQKLNVFKTIVKASGRTNPKINILSKVSGYFGAISLIVTFGVLIHGIIQSKTPILCIIKCVVVFKAGFLGAYFGSCICIRICETFRFATVTVFMVSIFGGLLTGVGAAVVMETIVSIIYSK